MTTPMTAFTTDFQHSGMPAPMTTGAINHWALDTRTSRRPLRTPGRWGCV